MVLKMLWTLLQNTNATEEVRNSPREETSKREHISKLELHAPKVHGVLIFSCKINNKNT